MRIYSTREDFIKIRTCSAFTPHLSLTVLYLVSARHQGDVFRLVGNFIVSIQVSTLLASRADQSWSLASRMFKNGTIFSLNADTGLFEKMCYVPFCSKNTNYEAKLDCILSYV